MKKLDILRLRKAAGLSQRELADKLAVQPSFISAIENGRSRFPEEKTEKLKEILSIDSLDEYMVKEQPEVSAVPPHTHAVDEGDTLSQMLRHLHNLAHKTDGTDREREKEMSERIDFLSKRNDRLSQRLDDLREKIDSLREENFRLKELLLTNNIKY